MTPVAVVASDGGGPVDVAPLAAVAPGSSATVAVAVAAGGEQVASGWLRVEADDRGTRSATTWAPRPADGLGDRARRAAFEAFAGWVVDTAARVGAGMVETKPADDVAFVDDWLAVLLACGFAEVAAARLMAAPLPLACPAAAPPGGVEAARLDDLAPPARDALHRLVGVVHGSSADRVDAADRRSGPEVLARLAGDRTATPVPDLWLAGLAGGEPVGYVLGSRADDDVWVVDLGVHPTARRRGVGRWLVATMLGRAAGGGAGASRAYALVDEVNVASRALHRSLGFADRPGVYRTWRRPGGGGPARG